MSWRKDIVEKELGVKVPQQYADFLDEYGIYTVFGMQVYGVKENLLGFNGVPCVIGVTQSWRFSDDLPHRYLVIHTTGLEDEIICLDTEDEKIYAISVVFGNHKIADSFDEWFMSYVMEGYEA